MQGNISEAKKLLFKYDKSPCSITLWYRALILLEEPDCPERDKEILDCLERSICTTITSYELLKKLYVLNGKLIEFIKSKAPVSEQASIIFARMGILFGCQAAEITDEMVMQYILADHEKGIVGSSISLAEMYTYGIFLPQSIDNALEILKKLTKSPGPHDDVSKMLHYIKDIAEKKEDTITIVTASYLSIVEQAKNGREDEILELLQNSEEALMTLKPDQRSSVAKLLIDSGAYNTLVRIAKNNKQIALKLVAIASARVTKFDHPATWYPEASEFKQQFIKDAQERDGSQPDRAAEYVNLSESSENNIKALNRIIYLIRHWIGSTEKTRELEQELTKQSENWKTVQETYKGASEFLKNKFKENPVNPALLKILQYLQENKVKGHSTMFADRDLNSLLDAWYCSLILFGAFNTSEKRNKLILETLAKGLHIPIHKYPFVKDLLAVDEELISLIQQLAETSDDAAVIFSRIGILFKNPRTGIHAEAVKKLHAAHEKGITDASICLAEMEIYGIQQSLAEAIKILHKGVELQKEHDVLMLDLLNRIKNLSDKNNPMTHLQASYLLIIQQIKFPSFTEQNYEAIVEKLSEAEMQFEKIDAQKKEDASLLLRESGAYKALLPIAKRNKQIASKLRDFAILRISKYGHDPKDYSEVLTPKNIPHARATEDHPEVMMFSVTPEKEGEVGFISTLIFHYIGNKRKAEQLNKELLSTYFSRPAGTNQTKPETGLFQYAYLFLENYFKTNNVQHPQLMGLINYLRSARDGETVSEDQEVNQLVVAWFRAILKFICQPSNQQEILDILQQGLYISINKYPQARNLLILDNDFIAHMRKLAENNILVSAIFARIALLIGYKEAGIDAETVERYLNNAHENGIIEASVCLAEKQVSQNPRSLANPIKIMQKVTTTSKKVDCNVLQLLGEIEKLAKTNEDYAARIHTLYLQLIQIARMCIAGNLPTSSVVIQLDTAENALNRLPLDKQNTASHLLKASGAYDELLPLAEQDLKIASTLFMHVYKRILMHSHQPEEYSEIIATTLKQLANTLTNEYTLGLLMPLNAPIKFAFQRGSIDASICLAAMHIHGISVPQSLQDALAILQNAITASKVLNNQIVKLLEIIEAMAEEKKDFANYLYALILDIFEQTKSPGNERLIYDLLETIKQFTSMGPSLAVMVSKLFGLTGVNQTLIPIAKQHKEVASMLLAIAENSESQFGISPQDLCELHRLVATPQKNAEPQRQLVSSANPQRQFIPVSEDCEQGLATVSKITSRLMFHYLGCTPSTQQLVEELLKNCQSKLHQPEFQDKPETSYCKYVHSFLETKLKEGLKLHPVLMQIVRYLANPGIHDIVDNWYQALIQFAVETATPERNKKILASLEIASFSPFSEYTPEINKLLIRDEQLIDHIKAMSATNDLAQLVLTRIQFLFNNCTVNFERLMDSLKVNHKKGITAASVWLAEMHVFGAQQSFSQALEILQEAAESKDERNPLIVNLLFEIFKLAQQKGNKVIALNALYLHLRQQLKERRPSPEFYNSLYRAMSSIEDSMEKIVEPEKKAEAAKLLITTGVYKALLPIASHNKDIATLLGVIVANRIQCYSHPEHTYEIALELGARALSIEIEEYKKRMLRHTTPK